MLQGLKNQLSYRKRGAHIVGIVLPIKSLSHMTSRSYPPRSHRGHALTRFLVLNKFTLVTRRYFSVNDSVSHVFSAVFDVTKKPLHLHLHSAILDHFHIWRHHVTMVRRPPFWPPKNTALVRPSVWRHCHLCEWCWGPRGPWCHGAMVPWCHGQVIWRFTQLLEGLAASEQNLGE